MPDDLRRFSPDDPNLPTSPNVQALLERRGQVDARPVIERPPPARPERALQPRSPASSVVLGTDDMDRPVTVDLVRLMAGRLLIQGMSGAGKSHTLRLLIERAHVHTTVVVVDPEGEFGNLAEFIGAVSVKGADTPPDALAALALRCREHRAHLHLDLSDLSAEERIEAAAAFFGGLTAAPREHWSNTVLVAVDEAHLLAPQAAATARDAEIRRTGVAALTDMCSRGRKRGIVPVIATQRLAKLAASVLAELQNAIIGINVLDRDIQRAADMLGWTADKAGILRDLTPGRFVCLGPALSTYPTVVSIASTETVHLGRSPALRPAAGLSLDEARSALSVDGLVAGRAAARPQAPAVALLDAGGALGRETAEEILTVTRETPGAAASLWAHLTQREGWPAVESTLTRTGPPHALQHAAVGRVEIDGAEFVSDPQQGSDRRTAEQRATLDILAQVIGVKPPASAASELAIPAAADPKAATPPDPASLTDPKGHLVNHVAVLNGWTVAFTSASSGPAHALTFSATVTVTKGGVTILMASGSGGSRKAAERAASVAALVALADAQPAVAAE